MMKKRKGSDSLCPIDKKNDIVESMGDSESLISNLECHYSSEDYVRIKKRCCKEDVAYSVEGVSGSRKIVATAMPCATSSVVLNRRGIKRKIGCIDVATQMGRKNRFVDDYITGDSIGKWKFGSLCLCRCRARGEEPESFHLVMELCSGGRLIDQMTKGGRYSEQRAANILKELMTVIKYCHDMGVVHRDVKPENILLTTSGKINLANFGENPQV
nr:serine/threonine-protein kinase PEPKR2 [Tanacetum cinerariifolium]